MQAIDDYLKNPTDPATLRALRGLKPKERKAALLALDEADALSRAELEGIPYRSELENQPEDTPGRSEGLAAWQRHHEHWKLRTRARAVIAMSVAKLPRRDQGWGLNTLLEPQVLELLVEQAPAWLPADYAGLVKGFSSDRSANINDLADALILAGLLPSPPADSDYHRRWEFHLAEKCDHSAAKAIDWIRQREGFLDHDALEWIRSHLTKGGVCDPEWYENHRGYCKFSRENGLPVRFWDLLLELASPAQRLAMQLALLNALAECSKDYFAHGGIRLWKAFGFPEEDASEVQESLAAVLRSPSPAATRFAIERLGGCVGEPWFDTGLLAEHLPTALLQPSKPLRREALALARRAMESDPSPGRLVAAMADAATDADAKVRGEFVSMVEDLPADGRAALVEVLAPRFAEIPMATRKKLESLIGELAETGSAPEPDVAIQPEPPSFARVEPVTGVDELVQIGAGLLDATPEPLDFERFLDGLLRFGSREPEVLSNGLDSLVKRARRFHVGKGSQGDDYCLVARCASELILTYSSEGRPDPARIRLPSDPPDPEAKPWGSYYEGRRGPFEFVLKLLGELLETATNGRESGLLSLPEFSDGSISPETLDARSEAMRQVGEEPTPQEQSLALLRCPGGKPKHRIPEGDFLRSGGFGNWSSDVRWRYTLTPHDLESAISQDLEHLFATAYLSGKTMEHVENAVALELVNRRPPLGDALCSLLFRWIGSTLPRQREIGVELTREAIHDGRFSAAFPTLKDKCERLIGYDPPGFDEPEVISLTWSLRELSSRSRQGREAVRRLLAGALEQPPKQTPKGLPGLLELALELFVEEPPADVASFSERWPDLSGKAKTLARKISSLGGK